MYSCSDDESGSEITSPEQCTSQKYSIIVQHWCDITAHYQNNSLKLLKLTDPKHFPVEVQTPRGTNIS